MEFRRLSRRCVEQRVDNIGAELAIFTLVILDWIGLQWNLYQLEIDQIALVTLSMIISHC